MSAIGTTAYSTFSRDGSPLTGKHGTLPCEWYAFARTLEQIEELFPQTLSGEYDDEAPWTTVKRVKG